MFLNIIVSIGSTVVIFHSFKPTGSTNQPEVQTNRKQNSIIAGISCYPGRRERIRTINNKRVTNLRMYNTKGDIALILSVTKTFPQPYYNLSMFLQCKFRALFSLIFLTKVLIKKRVYNTVTLQLSKTQNVHLIFYSCYIPDFC